MIWLPVTFPLLSVARSRNHRDPGTLNPVAKFTCQVPAVWFSVTFSGNLSSAITSTFTASCLSKVPVREIA